MLMAGIMGVVVTLGAMAMLVAGYVVGLSPGAGGGRSCRAERGGRVHRRRDSCAEARRTAGLNGARVTRAGGR